MKLLECLEVLATLAGIKPMELSDKLKANSEGEELDKATVEKTLNDVFGDKFRSVSDQQYSRGQREKGQTFESDLKKLYNLDSSKLGVDLVKDIVTARENAIRSEKGDKDVLTAENVGENPVVLAFVKDKVQTAVQAKTDELNSKVETLQTQLTAQARKEEKTKLQSAALSVLKAEKAILGKDDSIDPKRLKTINVLLSQGKFKLDGEKFIPVDENGEQLTDANFNAISFKDHIKELNPFGFHDLDPSRSSPSPTSKPASNPTPTKTQFKTRGDFLAFQNDPSKSYEDKKAAAEEWKAAQSTEE